MTMISQSSSSAIDFHDPQSLIVPSWFYKTASYLKLRIDRASSYSSRPFTNLVCHELWRIWVPFSTLSGWEGPQLCRLDADSFSNPRPQKWFAMTNPSLYLIAEGQSSYLGRASIPDHLFFLWLLISINPIAVTLGPWPASAMFLPNMRLLKQFQSSLSTQTIISGAQVDSTNEMPSSLPSSFGPIVPYPLLTSQWLTLKDKNEICALTGNQ